MKRLQRLFEDLDLVTQPSMKVRLIKDYLEQTPKEDLAWVLYFSKTTPLDSRQPRFAQKFGQGHDLLAC